MCAIGEHAERLLDRVEETERPVALSLHAEVSLCALTQSANGPGCSGSSLD
jgi:hypothetical protein